MNLNLHFHIANVNIVNDDKKLGEILEGINILNTKIDKMANELDDLTTEVQETKGIMQSAKVLIEGFAKKLEEAGTDKAKLTALKNDLNTGSEDLAAALAANPLPGENIPPAEETSAPTPEP